MAICLLPLMCVCVCACWQDSGHEQGWSFTSQKVGELLIVKSLSWEKGNRVRCGKRKQMEFHPGDPHWSFSLLYGESKNTSKKGPGWRGREHVNTNWVRHLLHRVWRRPRWTDDSALSSEQGWTELKLSWDENGSYGLECGAAWWV